MKVIAAPWVLLGKPLTPTLSPHRRERGNGSLSPYSDDPKKNVQATHRGERGSRGFSPLSPTGEGEGEGAIRDGAMVLDGDHLVAVGPAIEIEARYGRAERLDALLLPALVNAHLHLELSHLAGRVPGGEGLVPWLEKLVEARQRAPRDERAMAAASLALRRAGVAAVGEVTNTLESLPHLGREGFAGSIFHEIFGFSSERAQAASEAAAQMRRQAGPPPAGLRIAPSPHAVYSTHPRWVAELLSTGPSSIHLAEDPAERDFCTRVQGPFADLSRRLGATDLRPLGRSAVACAAPHLHTGALAVHAVDLDDEDLQDLVRCGATVVVCPRSNRTIGGRLPDLPRLLEARISLAVGSDSLASSPSLSPLAELAALQSAFRDLAPERLLPLAWNGACVGAPAVGRLLPGSAPGILAAPLAGARPLDPLSWLLRFGAEERPFLWMAQHRPEALVT